MPYSQTNPCTKKDEPLEYRQAATHTYQNCHCNSVESDPDGQGNYFDNMVLTSHKPYQPNNKCDCSKTNDIL